MLKKHVGILLMSVVLLPRVQVPGFSESLPAAPSEARLPGRKPASGGTLERAHLDTTSAREIALLKEQVALQQTQIELLRMAIEEQKRLLEQVLKAHEADPTADSHSPSPAGLGQIASLDSTGVAVPASTASSVRPIASAPSSPVTQAELHAYTDKVNETGKKLDGVLKSLGGFKFSGDFRFRADIQARSGNALAGPLQNARSRYRLRLNVDKELDPRFKFHMQLSTGPLNNGLTNDQDFAGMVSKHPFSIAEAYIDYHPNSAVSLRGGRMEEIFADNTRFLWDDDVRFNGFHQTVSIPFESQPLGFRRMEIRAAEYILSNPNVAILSPTSPFVSAGFRPGQKVRDANLFHPGVVFKGDLPSDWSHQFTSDIQIYRNPMQIELSTLPSGFPVVVSNALGIALSGPITGSGNATTAPGGAIYNARNFQIVRLAYRLEDKGFHVGGRTMPLWFDLQATRNTGTSKLRDAMMASINLGAVRNFGDVRFLYQFAIKDANSLISQLTDDDIGIGTGVNIAVHAIRFDLGLAPFLQWQNLFFIQEARRASNPAEQFFVPLQRGANTTFRYLGQLAFSF